MDIETVRTYCLSFPHATEKLQWGNDLVFKIAGKMFAVLVLEGASKYCLSFKCTEEKFAELIEEEWNRSRAVFRALQLGCAGELRRPQRERVESIAAQLVRSGVREAA